MESETQSIWRGFSRVTVYKTMSADTNSETQSNEQADVWLTPDQVDAMRDVAIDTGGGPKALTERIRGDRCGKLTFQNRLTENRSD